MALILPGRFRQVRFLDLHLHLRRIQRRHNFVLAALTLEEERQANEDRRTCWVRPWLQRRVLFRQYDTLFSSVYLTSCGALNPMVCTRLSVYVLYVMYAAGLLWLFLVVYSFRVTVVFLGAQCIRIEMVAIVSHESIIHIPSYCLMCDLFSFVITWIPWGLWPVIFSD